MMYGFGDARAPLPQTVQMMEELVVDYITDILRQAAAAAEQRSWATCGSTSTQIAERDLLFLLRKNRKRLDRVACSRSTRSRKLSRANGCGTFQRTTSKTHLYETFHILPLVYEIEFGYRRPSMESTQQTEASGHGGSVSRAFVFGVQTFEAATATIQMG